MPEFSKTFLNSKLLDDFVELLLCFEVKKLKILFQKDDDDYYFKKLCYIRSVYPLFLLPILLYSVGFPVEFRHALLSVSRHSA